MSRFDHLTKMFAQEFDPHELEVFATGILSASGSICVLEGVEALAPRSGREGILWCEMPVKPYKQKSL